jgi:hypothetical protein
MMQFMVKYVFVNTNRRSRLLHSGNKTDSGSAGRKGLFKNGWLHRQRQYATATLRYAANSLRYEDVSYVGNM